MENKSINSLEERVKNLELELLRQKELNTEYLKAFNVIKESLHSQSNTNRKDSRSITNTNYNK